VQHGVATLELELAPRWETSGQEGSSPEEQDLDLTGGRRRRSNTGGGLTLAWQVYRVPGSSAFG